MKISRGIVKLRYVILIAGILLLIPSAIGFVRTRINYDVLTYLPKDIETMVGQDILEDEFGTGAFSMVVVEGMSDEQISERKKKMEEVPHVKEVIWYDSFLDISIPKEILPDKLKKVFINEDADATMMAVTYDTTMSADETMDAIEQLRKVVSKTTFIAGMSAVTLDTKNLSEREAPIYVALAVLLCAIVLSLTMDSFLVPFVFLISIGMAIFYNLGSNIIFGEISYITYALSAVLQLGVTLDYSIFLWHSYEEHQHYTDDKKEAMAEAISATFQSVIGSSVTTIAGFIALCFMSFTLGLDIGLVMSKGVLFGVVACVTILPSLVLIFDKPLEKTKHKPLLGNFKKIPAFVQKFYPLILIIYAVIWIPAVIGYNNTENYYDLAGTLPDTLESKIANSELEKTFNTNTTHMILVDSSLAPKNVSAMCDEIRDVDGVKSVIGIDAMVDASLPRELIPEKIKNELINDNWQLLLVTSEYKTASDEVNKQCDDINAIIDKYDETGMLIGEAPCTKDLITITDHDFSTVNNTSISIILAIIFLVFRSASLPFILVATIEFAIYINMGIPYYTHTALPFIASIVIGTIQLGSTVDYAILMTSRYQTERYNGKSRKEAVYIAHSTSIPSILVSAFSFFGATFGVGMYSEIDIISSLCILMARGALISMVTVIFVLPSMLLAFDRVIIHTSYKFNPAKNRALQASLAAQSAEGASAGETGSAQEKEGAPGQETQPAQKETPEQETQSVREERGAPSEGSTSSPGDSG